VGHLADTGIVSASFMHRHASSPRALVACGGDSGCGDPAQFSREYRRQFGAPPSLDAIRMRNEADHPVASALSCTVE
jgi:hypothetical protein